MKRGMLLALATGLCLTAARAGPLSPADKYVECVERVAALSAHRHVGDVEVARSRVPDKVLRELASGDISHACHSQFEALDGDDLAEPCPEAIMPSKPPLGKLLLMPLRSGSRPRRGATTTSTAKSSRPGRRSGCPPSAERPDEHYIAPALCAEAVREANRREKTDEQAKEKTLAALPSVRYCLGLEYDTMPEKTEFVVNEALRRIQAMNDEEFGGLTDCSLRVRTAHSPIVQHCLGAQANRIAEPGRPFPTPNRRDAYRAGGHGPPSGDASGRLGEGGRLREARGGSRRARSH